MTTAVRVGMLLTEKRSQPSQNVPLWIFGLTQESSVTEYNQWCKDYHNQVVVLSLNDVYEGMSKVMQKKFVEIFPSVPRSELPSHQVWIQMAKICGGTLMWYRVMFHSLQLLINQMYDTFTQKPIVLVVPAVQAEKFKECIWKLQSSAHVKIFMPGRFPKQEDIDDALPFGLSTNWNRISEEVSYENENDTSFEKIFQECFAPILVQNLQKKQNCW